MEVMNMTKSGFLPLTVALLVICAAPLLAQDESRWLVARSLIEPTDLRIVWQQNLPLGKSETLDQLHIFGNRLCALTSKNYLSCLNRNDANVIFSSSIAPAGLPVENLQAFQDELITIVGSKLLEISSDLGAEKTSMQITSGVTCPIVRNESFFYIAGSDKRIHVQKAENKVQVFEVAAENDSLITSILAEEDFVIFATEAGNVISIMPDKPVKLWQFDAAGAIVPPIVRGSTSLYFACEDTCVYRIDLSNGELLWKYQTGAILDNSPQIGQRAVYQPIPEVGLTAVRKDSAKLLWELPDGLDLLAEDGDRAFVVTKSGQIVAMDNIKSKKLYSIDIGQPLEYVTNTADAKIYIADAKGRLACLEPIR